MSFLPKSFAKRKDELEEEIQAHLQMAIQIAGTEASRQNWRGAERCGSLGMLR